MQTVIAEKEIILIRVVSNVTEPKQICLVTSSLYSVSHTLDAIATEWHERSWAAKLSPERELPIVPRIDN